MRFPGRSVAVLLGLLALIFGSIEIVATLFEASVATAVILITPAVSLCWMLIQDRFSLAALVAGAGANIRPVRPR